jgi:hypothetical protein
MPGANVESSLLLFKLLHCSSGWTTLRSVFSEVLRADAQAFVKQVSTVPALVRVIYSIA